MQTLFPPPGLGVKMDESSIYGKFHWTHKSEFFNFSMGVPIHKKKSRDEITITTETGETPEKNDTTCGSPSLFSFIVTKGENSKMAILMLACEIDISSTQTTPSVRSARQCQ